jgi:RNA polymerase sigma-70 factor (ECF subfamily)
MFNDEKEKLEFVYKRWKKPMLNKAFAILADHELAEDAVSEAFIRVYKNLNKLEDLESGRTAAFLVMIVKNVSITMLNKQARMAFVDITEFDKADSFDLEDSVISKATANELLKVVNGLKDELKTPFLLKYAYDFSLKEIARMLNITENNTAVRIHRARSKLTEALQEGGYGDGN